jgi:glycosyltransferase involved in cell wall biosynthesis
MGKAGRERVVQHFGWPKIAERTIELYASLPRA